MTMSLGNDPQVKVCGFVSIAAKEKGTVEGTSRLGLATSFAGVNLIFLELMRNAWPEDWLCCFDMEGHRIGGREEVKTWFASQPTQEH
jgi:hypothetical protein